MDEETTSVTAPPWHTSNEDKPAIDKIDEAQGPKKSRITPVLLYAGLGFLFFTMLLLFAVAAREKGLRVKTESELKETKQAKEAVERDLEETLKAKIELETKYNEAKREAEALAQELANQKKAKEELDVKLKDTE